MIYQFDSETELIFSALLNNLNSDNKVYMVGGMVRDILMNRPVHDIDLSYSGSVYDYGKKVADHLNASFFMLNQKYQTARIIYQSETNQKRWIDIVATRENDILVDLTYRDFTINAIAIDLMDRTKMIDPLDGAQDLQRKLLRMCRKDSLLNDPVRILRAIRLAVQFGWKISVDTLAGIKSNAYRLMDVSLERKRDELFRIFDLQNSSIAIRLLSHLELLKYCFPELIMERNNKISKQIDDSVAMIYEFSKLKQVIVGKYPSEGARDIRQGELVLSLGRFRHAIENYFCLKIHQDRSLNAIIILCILYYGARQPFQDSQNGKNHQFVIAEKKDNIIENIAKTLVLSSAEKKWMYGLFAGIAIIDDIVQNDIAVDPEIAFMFYSRSKLSGVAACLVSLANYLIKVENNSHTTVWQKYLTVSRFLLDSYFCHYDEWINPPAFVNGHDVMKILNINDGKKIGWWINQLKIASIHGTIKNHKEAVNFLVTHKDIE